VLRTTGNPFGLSLLTPLSDIDNKVDLEKLSQCRMLVDDLICVIDEMYIEVRSGRRCLRAREYRKWCGL
jgi:hypothetical protein